MHDEHLVRSLAARVHAWCGSDKSSGDIAREIIAIYQEHQQIRGIVEVDAIDLQIVLGDDSEQAFQYLTGGKSKST
jgi:hypothetical protein